MRVPVLLLAFLHQLALAAAVALPKHFLVASFPSEKRVGYYVVDKNKPPPTAAELQSAAFATLIETGLSFPMGVAVSPTHIFVADRDAKAVYSYPYAISGDALSVGANREEVVTNIETDWVTVDETKNMLFVSSVGNNAILQVDLTAGAASGAYESKVLYHGLQNGGTSGSKLVNSPSGVSADPVSGQLFWGNKFSGLTVGAVAGGQLTAGATTAGGGGGLLAGGVGAKPKGLETTPLVDSVTGICASHANVFYMDGKNGIYCVKKAGSNPVQISSMLNKATGCTWDGDGTVYVTDTKAVYRMPANQSVLRPMLNLEKVIDAIGVNDVAVIDATSTVGGLFR